MVNHLFTSICFILFYQSKFGQKERKKKRESHLVFWVKKKRKKEKKAGSSCFGLMPSPQALSFSHSLTRTHAHTRPSLPELVIGIRVERRLADEVLSVCVLVNEDA